MGRVRLSLAVCACVVCERILKIFAICIRSVSDRLAMVGLGAVMAYILHHLYFVLCGVNSIPLPNKSAT